MVDAGAVSCVVSPPPHAARKLAKHRHRVDHGERILMTKSLSSLRDNPYPLIPFIPSGIKSVDELETRGGYLRDRPFEDPVQPMSTSMGGEAVFIRGQSFGLIRSVRL
jgi:hypothetical protein